MSDSPSKSTTVAQGMGSRDDSRERSAAEFARVADGLEQLRRLIMIGGVIVILLMVIALIIELDMLHIVQGIKTGG